MIKYYYKKTKKFIYRKTLRITGLLVFFIGLFIALYIFTPFLYWQIYIKPSIASSDFISPIPNSSFLVGDFLEVLNNNLTNVQSWFPTFKTSFSKSKVYSYRLSIPKLGIKNAIVSNVNNNLDKHLVAYDSGTIPPDKGNAVVFGHSTILQWFNPKAYTAIFTDIYKLKPGDKIIIRINDKQYEYRVYHVLIVNPSDTSVLDQDYNNSFLTLVTCTPPGTIWKRLIIQAILISSTQI